MKLIDKDALVAEIERAVKSYDPTNKITSGRYALVRLRKFIDTLEVKEVDLNKEISKYIALNICPSEDIVKSIAKHFFELGKQYRGE